MLPKGKVVLSLDSGSPWKSRSTERLPECQEVAHEFVVESTGEANFLTMTVPTTATVPFTSLHARYRGEQDPTEQALLRDRLLGALGPLTPASAETSLPLASPPFPLSGEIGFEGKSCFMGIGRSARDVTRWMAKGEVSALTSARSPIAVLKNSFAISPSQAPRSIPTSMLTRLPSKTGA